MSITAFELAKKVGQILDLEPYSSKGSINTRIEADLAQLPGARALSIYGPITDNTITIIDTGPALALWCGAISSVINLAKIHADPHPMLKCHEAMFEYIDSIEDPVRYGNWNEIIKKFATGSWSDNDAVKLAELLARSGTLIAVRRIIIADVIRHFHPKALEE